MLLLITLHVVVGLTYHSILSLLAFIFYLFSRALEPFHPTFDVNEIITDALMRTLPNDAHEKVNGRLNISVTRVSDGKNCILSQFDSKEDLIQVSVSVSVSVIFDYSLT